MKTSQLSVAAVILCRVACNDSFPVHMYASLSRALLRRTVPTSDTLDHSNFSGLPLASHCSGVQVFICSAWILCRWRDSTSDR